MRSRSFLDNPWFSIPYLCFLVLGLAYALVNPHGQELVDINPLRVEPLNIFFILATKLGESYFWIAAILLLTAYRWRLGLTMALAALVMIPTAWILKHEIGVPRPSAWLDMNGLQYMVVKVPGIDLLGGFNSMPSGHTMLAFSMFGLLSLMLRPADRILGLLLFWTAFLVAFSRMFLVQHFLRDVLSGSVFGLLIADFAWQVYRRRVD